MHTTDSWGERFLTLFYIFVSNFILPIIFNIAEIAVIFYDTNFLHGLVVVTVNSYVTILGVLLATIWAQGSAKGKLPARAGSKGGRKTTHMTTLQFASRQVPDAEGQTSQDGDDELGFSEDESLPSMREKGRVINSGRGSDSVTQGSIQEEIREKRSSGSSGGRPSGPSRATLCESVSQVTAGDASEHRDPSSPVSIYASDPESFHTAMGPISEAV